MKRVTCKKLPTIFEHRDFVEVDVVRPKFQKSFTDQSFYTPNSEANKTLNTQMSGGYNGIYDTDLTDIEKVDDRLVALRKPGADISEIHAVVKEMDKEVKDNQKLTEHYKNKAAETDNILNSIVQSSNNSNSVPTDKQ